METRDLTLVVSGAPLAARTADIAHAAGRAGWRVTVVATAAGLLWMDEQEVRDAVGHSPRVEYRKATEAKSPRPEAVLACPLTFNSANKLIAGIADNYALGVLCESVGARVPLIIAPMVSDRLGAHPVWSETLRRLTEAGARLLDVQTGETGASLVPSGTGLGVVEHFDPAWVVTALGRI